MSWAEIKKAVNSNIDVPLNTYIAPPAVIVRTESGNTIRYTTDETIIFDIQGRGIIDWIRFLRFSATIKLYIDGEIYDNVDSNNFTYEIVNSECLNDNSTINSEYLPRVIFETTRSLPSFTTRTAKTEVETLTQDSTMYVNRGIVFNKSAKLIVQGASTGTVMCEYYISVESLEVG